VDADESKLAGRLGIGVSHAGGVALVARLHEMAGVAVSTGKRRSSSHLKGPRGVCRCGGVKSGREQ